MHCQTQSPCAELAAYDWASCRSMQLCIAGQPWTSNIKSAASIMIASPAAAHTCWCIRQPQQQHSSVMRCAPRSIPMAATAHVQLPKPAPDALLTHTNETAIPASCGGQAAKTTHNTTEQTIQSSEHRCYTRVQQTCPDWFTLCSYVSTPAGRQSLQKNKSNFLM